MREWISGRNPIYEVLRAKRRQVFRLRLAEGLQETERISEILRECALRKAPVERVRRSALDSLAENHQGLALEVSAYPYAALSDILAKASRLREPAFILALDTLQDPQNLGTLLRTAEAVGVHGVLLPLKRTATVTPAVVHASSGACEHLLITQVNLAQALAELKRQGIWVAGLENHPGAQDLTQARLEGPLAVVVGNEAEGMRALVRESCDLLLRLPMVGKVESLNAAVAGSIALYFVWQDRMKRNLAIDGLPES